MLIREILPDDKENYNAAVSHVTQSFEWGEFKHLSGAKLLRLGKFEGENLIYGFQLTFHTAPFGVKIGYLPRIDAVTPEIFEALVKIGIENNLLFIKIEPNILKSDVAKMTQLNEAVKNFTVPFLKTKPIIPNNTFLVDLTKTEDEILTAMHEKTRYNIHVSEKHNVKVRLGETVDDLSIFLNLQRQTARRQNFEAHADSYFVSMRESLKDKGMWFQLIAEIDKPVGYVTPSDTSLASLFFKKNTLPLSSIILFRFKNTLYYPYGGSALAFREKMANHAIHWAAIKLGKKLGCTKYDLWGCLGENPNPHDPWFGFHRFKQGFGGQLISYCDSYDLVFHPKLYQWFNHLNNLRFTLLKLKNFVGL
jgi:lipid II:glycine glycyltransferase (peptidoglycan interpeptide bridge formation enzyme)